MTYNYNYQINEKNNEDCNFESNEGEQCCSLNYFTQTSPTYERNNNSWLFLDNPSLSYFENNKDLNIGQYSQNIFTNENIFSQNEQNELKSFDLFINRNSNNNILGKKTRHTKREDNLTRKIVNNVEKNVINLINDHIKNLNKTKNNEDSIKLLKPINHDIKKYYKVDKVKNLIKSKFKDILSEDLNLKFSETFRNQNRIIIQKIYDEYKNEGKNIINILDKTFIDVLNYYNNENYKNNPEYLCLNNLENYKILKGNIKEEEEYFLKHFEEKIFKKLPRKSKKMMNKDGKNKNQ